MIACRDAELVLAHLKNGSLAVQEGAMVITGQKLGQAGNSGNTSEPHLHIHAVQTGSPGEMVGKGVPILFEDTFPVRNTVFIKLYRRDWK